ncbi:L-lactate dehydrogenase [Petrotoga sp. 9PWA.NaAc.5.4]|uniref:L-lactate dehydrogenase n=1 Tax=Petrotoga sp. 9PWA.NaAc.5.4 TaxID=1434328 RepID=UPI000CC69B86|nr:L-lactate dehydrogenase [Petrotoga sp. 9PWA.NaAc.5.4]PNR97012.1 lactate dehydrogenase [Petrotoga sp. 9PWA.NaAc.5.4]
MKVSIIGIGKVGSSVAFSLLNKAITDELVLIDRNKILAEGEALDLLHASAFHKRMVIRSGEYEDIQGSDIIIVTAGAAQKIGETRLDLALKNAQIIKEISENIKKYAPNSIVINITNPVDVMSYVVWKVTGFDSNRVFGTGTILDTARLRALIGSSCGVSPMSIHAYIIGEHGDSELAVWSSAMIGGVPINKFCEKCPLDQNCIRDLDEIFEEVKNSAYTIIEKKGATNYGIAAATAALVDTIAKNEGRVYTTTVLLDDLYIGYPTIINKDGVERVVNISLSEEENEKFEISKNIIREYIKKIESQIFGG